MIQEGVSLETSMLTNVYHLQLPLTKPVLASPCDPLLLSLIRSTSQLFLPTLINIVFHVRDPTELYRLSLFQLVFQE